MVESKVAQRINRPGKGVAFSMSFQKYMQSGTLMHVKHLCSSQKRSFSELNHLASMMTGSTSGISFIKIKIGCEKMTDHAQPWASAPGTRHLETKLAVPRGFAAILRSASPESTQTAIDLNTVSRGSYACCRRAPAQTSLPHQTKTKIDTICTNNVCLALTMAT